MHLLAGLHRPQHIAQSHWQEPRKEDGKGRRWQWEREYYSEQAQERAVFGAGGAISRLKQKTCSQNYFFSLTRVNME